MTPSPIDLFGEVPVTVPDLYLWCEVVVPHISAARLNYYIKHWDVAGKIRMSKLAGEFDALEEQLSDRLNRTTPHVAVPQRLSHLVALQIGDHRQRAYHP